RVVRPVDEDRSIASLGPGEPAGPVVFERDLVRIVGHGVDRG
ncbi:MAG: hypothetical protein JWO31_2390, partial [Phycisphaerales bacterium]|nr:hypothetical protein [Phycisphaerales bacterium]